MFTQLPNTTCEFQSLKYSVTPEFSSTAQVWLSVFCCHGWVRRQSHHHLYCCSCTVACLFLHFWCSSLFLSGCGNGFSSQENPPEALEAWVSPLLLATEVGYISNNIHSDLRFRLGPSDQLYLNVIAQGPTFFFSSAVFKCVSPTRPSLVRGCWWWSGIVRVKNHKFLWCSSLAGNCSHWLSGAWHRQCLNVLEHQTEFF